MIASLGCFLNELEQLSRILDVCMVTDVRLAQPSSSFLEICFCSRNASRLCSAAARIGHELERCRCQTLKRSRLWYTTPRWRWSLAKLATEEVEAQKKLAKQ